MHPMYVTMLAIVFMHLHASETNGTDSEQIYQKDMAEKI